MTRTSGTYEEGFSLRTVLGALFIGLVMMPGSIYLGLVAGQSIGPAAEWVTIILFNEVARRTFSPLKRQELYILYYVAGGLTGIAGGVALSGGPFAGLIWNQFLVQSPAAETIAPQIPHWAAPPAGSPALLTRTLWDNAWKPAIAMVVLQQVLGRAGNIGLGYALFRLTADVERLPFPLAPVAAEGATTLAETGAQEVGWRPRVFYTGAVLGGVFGVFYVGVPALTGLFLPKPFEIIPIPWVDTTTVTERLLPATPTGISTALHGMIVGMVLPFWAVVGTAVGALATLVANPFLHRAGVLHTWRPGMDVIYTSFANQVDFWLSFTVGAGLAVAVVSLMRGFTLLRRGRAEAPVTFRPPPGRGDFSVLLAIGLFLGCMAIYLWVCDKVVPGFPLVFFAVYGFVITPLYSLVHAQVVGAAGEFAGIPYLRQAAIILSGAKGAAIWFAPIPIGVSYGAFPQRFKELELSGTRFSSLIKAELLITPIILICSFGFWAAVWRMGPIPSVSFPYAQKMWHFYAMEQTLWMSSTTSEHSLFREAMRPATGGVGLACGLGAYALISRFGWPMTAFYGLIRGLGAVPHGVVLELAGALMGRYWLARLVGKERWGHYTPVLLAGFACGTGLAAMVFTALTLLSGSAGKAPF